MFRTQLENWGAFNKKLSPDEVLLMARVNAQRKKQGAESEFWRYGRRVSKANFERYLRDHPHIASRLRSCLPHDRATGGYIEGILPPHIVVLTPSPSLNLGDELHSIESMLFNISNYIKSIISVEQSRIIAGMMPAEFDSLLTLFRLSDQPLNSRTSPLITSHFDEMRTLLQEESMFLLLWLMWSYMILIDFFRREEFTRLWLFQARDLCLALKGHRHPLSGILCTLLTFSGRERRKQPDLINLILQVLRAGDDEAKVKDDRYDIVSYGSNFGIMSMAIRLFSLQLGVLKTEAMVGKVMKVWGDLGT